MAVAFTVTPMRQSIKLEAGQVYQGYITIANPQSATENLSYFVQALPFSVKEDGASADFATESNRTLMAKWLKIDEPTGELKPNETRRIHWTIEVPSSVPAGGQYAAVAVSAVNDVVDADKMNVQNVFEIASLIYAEVEGETVHAGEVMENSVPGFSVSNDVKTVLELKNNGNVHEEAVTTITVKEVLTGNYILKDDNEYVDYVMPDSERYVTRQIDGLAELGIYEVVQSVKFAGSEENRVTQTLVIMPVWFMLLVAFTVVAFVWLMVRTVVRHRRAGEFGPN